MKIIMDNNKKIILDICGGTGSWSLPYKEKGYDVRVLTLPDYDITKKRSSRLLRILKASWCLICATLYYVFFG
jgi:hypothetical protein